MLFPTLIVLTVNVMWITTQYAGPFLPSDKVINIIQQTVQPIVAFGITAVGLKVTMGLRWRAARSNRGVKLADLLGKVGPSGFRHTTGMREVLIYLLLGVATFIHLTINVGAMPKILVPGFTTAVDATVGIPRHESGSNLTAGWIFTNDFFSQPMNLDEYLDAEVPGTHRSPGLLASPGLDLRELETPAIEVTIPAVLVLDQTYDTNWTSYDWFNTYAHNFDRFFEPDNSSYPAQFGYSSSAGTSRKFDEMVICLNPPADVDPEGSLCAWMQYQLVIASVAYDNDSRIRGSYIHGYVDEEMRSERGWGHYQLDLFYGASFSEILGDVWFRQEAKTLLQQTLAFEIGGGALPKKARPARYGTYRPTKPYPVHGVIAYVAVSTAIVLYLCAMLVTVNPKEAIEPPGLLALSRWPTELAAQLYGTKESLSKAGKKRVFLHEMGPKEWALSSEKAVPPADVHLPYQTGPQLPYQSEDMVEKPLHRKRPSMPKRLSSSSSKRHSDSYRVSRPSYSSRPSYQSRPSYHSKSSYSPPRLSPRPSSSPIPVTGTGSGARPGYPSRPSYSSRPSYQSRPSSSSRDRPSLSRSRSQEEYFESEEGPEMHEGRWGVHDIR